MKLRKGLCSDQNDKSYVDSLAAVDIVTFILGNLHLGFYKCKIMFDLFYFPLVEPTKGTLNMGNVSKDQIGYQILHVSCELIEDICSEMDRIIMPGWIKSLKIISKSSEWSLEALYKEIVVWGNLGIVSDKNYHA